MTYVQWDDALLIGVEQIDAQHKSLVFMLNTLHEASVAGDAAIVPEIITKLKEYALMHFATEERYMKRNKYPDLFDHMSEHAFFVSKIKDFTATTSPQIDMLPAVLDFLKKWLVEHISNIDIKMGRFLQENM